MTFIDYLTISLAMHSSKIAFTTLDILYFFAQILPKKYIDTCKDVAKSNGPSQKVSQYGITVSKQYGTATSLGWVYTVHLGGNYFQAIEYDLSEVILILQEFDRYRISRLDLARDVCIPLQEWQQYYLSAFTSGKNVIGIGDARTVYHGSRTSQFYTRIYNKTAKDEKHFPAPNGFLIVRYEIEIKRIRGEQVLENAFDTDFTNRLFLQRVRAMAKDDETGFITKHFDNGDEIEKIRTVKRVVGDLEKSVSYVYSTYINYFIAGANNQAVQEKFKQDDIRKNSKAMKISAVLNSLHPNNECTPKG